MSEEQGDWTPEGTKIGKLEREEGVIRADGAGTDVGCEPAEAGCTSPEMGEETSDDDPVGGTPDDLPYTLGEETPDALDERMPNIRPVHLDQVLHPPRSVSEDDEDPDADSGEERDLWDRMSTLSEQDEGIGSDLEGVSEEQAARIMNAMGDDAAEVLPQAPEGVSATGAGSEPFRPEGFGEDE